MGSGPGRTLSEAGGPEKVVTPELATKLAAVLDQFDARDPEFKAGRDDARFQQRVKDWGRVAKEVDGYLRRIGNAIYKSHQLSLDVGSDGGGHSTKPWLEDLGRKFGRADFRMVDGDIVARGNDKELGKMPIDDVTEDWIEEMIVAWLVAAASR